MNHIDFYEKIISDLSIEFETRHFMKQFYNLDLKTACETVEMLSRMLRLKQIDYDTLKRASKFDTEHN